MCKELPKSYEPSMVEDKIYKFWLENGYFKAEVDEAKKPYTVVIPPPNVTGKLHMGHALDETLQDILVRFKRMKGFNALWIPGTDHAAIATEVKVVEAMKKEGLTKEMVGRGGFLKRAYEWKEKYGGTILSQIKKLGASCDWDRERFTMDDGLKEAIKEAFVNLYNKGLIYRGERIVNWCPRCKTSLSDAEVEFKEKEGSFWHIKYPLADGTGYVEIATTRPETLLGDTAVAVHPDDERYKNLIGQMLIVPIIERKIPIIADQYVEMDFGTGAVKITPAHDPNDFEVGLRHKLPFIDVMDDHAFINENGGKYCGLYRDEARKRIIKDLDEQGFITKINPIHHNVGTCYRCSETVEAKVSTQWFVKMEPLAKPAINCIKEGKTKFIPDRFDKIFFSWMENIRDWCISRQLWWGHRIPAYYCLDCGELMVSKDNVEVCSKCGSCNVKQDEDVLDTWFSSALWPFAVLGWPENTPDFKYFYPTNTLVTGYDIIFFWVARMIFSAIEYTGKAPFETVLIHGLVRDSEGRKMSKSLGNGIDPMEVIEKYGADALRFSLATGNSPGNDMRYSDEKVNASWNFANKIWNAARFIHMNIDGTDSENKVPENLNSEDKWILSRLNTVTKEVTENIEKFELGIAVQKLYDFIWDEFCDWYIEFAKIRIQSSEEAAQGTRCVLIFTMTSILKLLHPFMPFITEEIWQTLPHKGRSIMVADYPEYNSGYEFKEAEKEVSMIMDVIRAIRNRRSEMNVPPSKKAALFIDTNYCNVFRNLELFIKKLAYGSTVEVNKGFSIDGAITIVTNNAKVFIPMDDLVDKQAETLRLKKELEVSKKELARDEGKLNNQGFLSKAPKSVIDGVRESANALKEKIKILEAAILKYDSK